MPMVRILADMEFAGMHIDTDYLREYRALIQKEADALESEVKKVVGSHFNIGSTEQLSKYLFDDPNGCSATGVPGHTGEEEDHR